MRIGDVTMSVVQAIKPKSASGVTRSGREFDKDGGKLYWSDREGMRVMRANLDGSQLETLVEA
jgi:sugar lactone lactonase YvrE